MSESTAPPADRRGSADQDTAADALGRRGFLETTALAAAGLAVGCGGDDDVPPSPDAGGRPDAGLPVDGGLDAGGLDAGLPDAGRPAVEPPDDTPEVATFGLGVASGDVTTEQVILWTRYDGSAPLRLVVWEMMGDVYARTVYDAAEAPRDGGFVHVDVAGLTAGLRYRYAFFEMDTDARVGRSTVGRFRAAIPDSSREPLTIGATSCTRNGRAFDTLSHAAGRDDLDIFLNLGDTTYNDDAVTLGEYRAKWAENLGTDGYRALRAAVSGISTWDDHEVENDYDPERLPAAQMAAALAAFEENTPFRPDPAAPGRIWKRLRWGQTLEVFVLDCRSERLPSTRTSGSPIYVSREQMDWFKAGLLASPAVFKLIMNSVPISDFPFAFDLARNDRWEGYGAQRDEILQHIDDNAIGGVLWVSGDFHMASMGRVSPSGVGASQIEVLVGPGNNNPNVLAATLGGPQFDWATSSNNYAVLELDPATAEVRIWYHDADDLVIETRTYAL